MTAPGGRDVLAAMPDDALVGFKRHLHPTVVPGEATYLVSPRNVTALHGVHAEVLVPLLDGTRSVRSVLHAAAPALTAEEAGNSLRELTGSGLLNFRPAPSGNSPAALSDPVAEAYWDLAGLDGGQASAELARSSVRIVTVGDLNAESVGDACRDSRITVAAPGSPAGFSLVLCDDYLAPGLREVDAEHRASGTPWLIAKMSGADPWVGPVFRPDRGPCWSCLAARLRCHRGSERPVRRALGLDGPLARPTASLAAGRSIAVHIAVLETAKWMAGMRYPSQNLVHTLDTLLLQVRTHPVSRLPQCAVCGDPGTVARTVRAPFVPVSRPKADQELGGDRALTPEEMLDRYGHLVSPVTGIVKEIRRAPHTPDFVNSYLSGHNLAVSPHTLAGLRSGLRALSGGKGLSGTEARTSALCEAVERYSGTRQGDEPVVRDSYRALGPAAVHPNSCQLYDERQYRTREAWNRGRSHFQYVPRPFDEDMPTEWTPVWSLTERTQRLLPTSMLYFGNGSLAGGGTGDGLLADSNGNAAGSSPEDALIQGFLEIVERDAVALWWYNRTRQPAVDLDAFDAPYVRRFRDGYRRIGRELWVLDLTSDFGIPVMAALSRRTDKPAQDVIFGFGAHFDPRVALRRALTEMGQLLPAVSMARADGSGYALDDPDLCTWWHTATTDNQPYLQPDPGICARTPRSWVYTPHADLLADVEHITRLVRSRGMELLVLDQTRPDLAMPVVKVIVPGMRHFWARLGPGRLYQVPVELGRLSRPTDYGALNPIPLFV
ncbi:TOMM precursor leader peptide-binding protein [Streptomyces sp. NBC_01104]|uniref:TOMM precursor leader peptide-binding protein n=1 Tax=Streptomyces sp. NBC_01104 TaxID=2903750 RepID=UPI003867B9CD|nr:TOMM precursor leader peptide-binding protein [Streptomyces sp. NBC_01104]